MYRTAPHVLTGLLGAILVAGATAPPMAAQQRPDTVFRPEVGAPTWPDGGGPRVAVDEAHHEMHTIDGSYTAFARLLRADGYRVEAFRERLTPASLAGIDVLVMANALAPENVRRWHLPTPSAFDPDEVEAAADWVREGGALLLVADHMPFPGAVESLARAFGIEVVNGFAVDTAAWDPFVFRASDGSLAPHPITRSVDSVATFTGQAFRPLPGDSVSVRPLLVLGPGVLSLNPDTAWVFHADTPTTDVGGWLQGAAIEHGRGRVVVLGEAAMLTAQRAGPDAAPMGMNHPLAAGNGAFTLSVMEWLSGGGG